MNWKAMTPAELAARIIENVMLAGSAKEGCDDSWIERPNNHHLDRAIRHILTHKLIAEGNQEPDGERHLHLALTRLAMALWKASCN